MEEHDPALPGVVQRPSQLFGAGEHTEAALSIGVLVGIALVWLPYLRLGGRGAGGQIDDRFGSLTGEVGGDHQQHVVVRRADIRNPLGRNPVTEQVGFRKVGERSLGLRSGGWFGGDVEGDLDLANRFPDFDDLGGAGNGVGFDLAPRGPVVGRVVMVDVAEHDAALDPMEDQTDVTAGTS